MLSLANVRFVILLHVQHVGGLVAFATITAKDSDEDSFRSAPEGVGRPGQVVAALKKIALPKKN